MGWLLITGSSSGDVVLFDCFKKTSVARILRADEVGVNTVQVCTVQTALYRLHCTECTPSMMCVVLQSLQYVCLSVDLLLFLYVCPFAMCVFTFAVCVLSISLRCSQDINVCIGGPHRVCVCVCRCPPAVRRQTLPSPLRVQEAMEWSTCGQ